MSPKPKKLTPHPKLLRGIMKTFLTSGDVKKLRSEVEGLLPQLRHPWDRGYLSALIWLMDQTSSPDKVLEQISIEELRKESGDVLLEIFERRSKDRVLNGFDRGYFSALRDYLRYLRR